MEPIICFIDDSDFEHDMVRDEIAPAGPGFTFVQAYTFEEARKMLGDRIPALFLLDLWGQDPDVVAPSLTPKEELQERISHLKTLDSVYEGLEGLEENQANEYLKRFFTIVDGWRDLFEEVCARVGQNRKYGLANIREARAHYPWVPAVFYTRKSLITDAVAMFGAGADGLFIKPTGKNDQETRVLTRDYGPTLIKELTAILDRKTQDLKEKQDLSDEKFGSHRPAIRAFIKTWEFFRSP
jgi:DNA-binding response OmpR family regulator